MTKKIFFMALFLCLALFQSAHAQNKYALLIGVDYDGSLALDYTRQDAIEMGRVLKDNFGYKTKVLTKKNETTKEAILIALADLKKNGKDYENVVFFFSGHGQRDKGSNEVGYLLPNDVKENNLLVTAIDMGIIRNLSKTLKSKQVLFIMDCCYSGIAGAYTSMDIAGGNKLLRSRQILTAGSSEQKARIYESQGLSAYTYYLTRALSRGGDFIRADSDKDGEFTARDLQTYVEKKVSNYTKKKQTPRIYNYSEDEGTFLFRSPNDIEADIVVFDGDGKTKGGSVPAKNVPIIQPGQKYGTIEVISQYDGRVYVDDRDSGHVSAGLSWRLYRKVGPHSVKVEGENENQTQEITVFHNSISEVFFVKKNGAKSAVPPMAITRPETPTQNSTTAPQTAPASPITNSIGMKFVYIEPGSFDMGSPSDEPGRRNNEIQHKVILTQGYYMQTTEVTQGQWRSVMGNNPSRFKDCGDKCPVEKISWDDVQKFIKKLNQKEGVSIYRLPTEAEWEYAARAGTTTPFSLGDGKCLSTDQANYDGRFPMPDCPNGEYREKTVPVASFQPNGWGLYDMHGNVREWCQDWYGKYPEGSVINPAGPRDGVSRVMRGGGWFYNGRFVRSAYRNGSEPGYRWYNDGFRLARGH